MYNGDCQQPKEKNMTYFEFLSLTGELLIEPGLAMEDQNVRDLLKSRATIETVREYISQNF
tara:strand:- start:19 stop:201 length:183 start_codon:yes stop_codon:yes gene_type:complete